jgi:hypothetical protein
LVEWWWLAQWLTLPSPTNSAKPACVLLWILVAGNVTEEAARVNCVFHRFAKFDVLP